MSGFFILAKQIHKKGKTRRPARLKAARVLVVSLLIFGISTSSALANPLDWFLSGRNNKKDTNLKSADARALSESTGQMQNRESEKSLTGQNLDSLGFAKAHWTNARNKLEKICREIIKNGIEKSGADLIIKLFTIDTQVFKLAVKNSAQAVGEIMQANRNIRQKLEDLRGIITSPGKATLEHMESAVEELKFLHKRQLLRIKKYLAGSESIIKMGNKSYETLELIPSLSADETNMLIDSSKQLMKLARSNGEASKGLLLNVQSSCEQSIEGLEMIKSTVRETLRFSDHFAIKQFPLINLPAPSREKIYSQIKALKNGTKGINNTLSIGDSQVRNTSQQFSHMVSAFGSKAQESLKFKNERNNYGNKKVQQISNYAYNQVAGLYQRIKEDVKLMRNDMLAVVKSADVDSRPEVKIESRSQFAARRTSRLTQSKLPLFLLGKTNKVAAEPQAKPEVEATELQFAQKRPRAEKSVATSSKPEVVRKVLYQEDNYVKQSEFIQPEINILKDELGENFFFEETESGSGNMESEEDYYDDGDEYYADSEEIAFEKSEADHENIEKFAEPEIELMQFESETGSLDDQLPMMRVEEEEEEESFFFDN
ncbi:MAG: hypothetical protein ACQETH_13300 [Candidatus Rifleibacteriota bacterium]